MRFSIIEVLIILAILGILVAVLLPNLQTSNSCLNINSATYQELTEYMSPEEAIEIFVSRPVTNSDLREIIGRQNFREMEAELCSRIT